VAMVKDVKFYVINGNRYVEKDGPPRREDDGGPGRERQVDPPGGTRAATPEEIAAAKDAAAKREAASSGPEPGPGPDNAGQPASREDRLAAQGFSGEGLNTDQVENAGDGFPGDRPQSSAAGGSTAGARPASPAAENDKDPGSSATGANSTASGPAGAGQADFGFVDLANALAAGKTWPALVDALQSLTKGEAWKHADEPMRARARAAVFMRLKELVTAGLKFDFIDDAHAFRCYIEFETDADAIDGNFRGFKLSAVYGRLTDAGKAAFDKAVSTRLAIIAAPPSDAGATEGDFN
jgi:hypothetical protein